MELIGPLQLRVMHYIWRHGPSTVHQVHDSINAEPGAQQLAYTTILTVMRNLSRRKILSQKPIGRSHLFEALIDEETYKVGMLRSIREEYFGGDVQAMLRTLAQDSELQDEHRQQLTVLV